MKTLILILLLSTFHTWAKSVVPHRVTTPPLDLFDRSNKILENGDAEVRVTTYSKKGNFIHHGEKKIIPKDTYAEYINIASAVYEMVPDESMSDGETRRGTAFSIGNNLVLTNLHVLDQTFKNTTSCSDFQLRDHQGETFDCERVHYCHVKLDICLIEMAPKTVTKRDCAFCSGTKEEVSLANGPSLKLINNYNPDITEREKLITTAIGNSAGFGIHLSQGTGILINRDLTYFYAPITSGNSGGALLNKDGVVIGVVKQQSSVHISENPHEAYNIAASSKYVIQVIRNALKDNPNTLLKFNQSVIE